MSDEDKEWTKTFIRWLRQVNLDHSLPPAAKNTAFWIGDSVDRTTSDKRCSYSQGALAKKSGIKLRSIKSHINKLRTRKHLRVTRRGVDRPNWYHLLIKDAELALPGLSHDGRESEAFSNAGGGMDLAAPNVNEGQVRAPQNINEGQSRAPQNVNEVHGIAAVRCTELPPIRLSFPSKPTNLPDEAARASGQISDCSEEAVRSERPRPRWDDFLAAYPFDAKMSRDAARVEFEKLADGDQDWAVESAPKYRATLGAGVATFAANWLKRRLFEDHPRSATPAAENGRMVFVERDTDAWHARVAAGHRPTLTTDQGTKTGWWFRTPFPAGHAPPAAARAAATSTPPAPRSQVRVVPAPPFQRSFGGRG